MARLRRSVGIAVALLILAPLWPAIALYILNDVITEAVRGSRWPNKVFDCAERWLDWAYRQ